MSTNGTPLAPLKCLCKGQELHFYRRAAGAGANNNKRQARHAAPDALSATPVHSYHRLFTSNSTRLACSVCFASLTSDRMPALLRAHSE